MECKSITGLSPDLNSLVTIGGGVLYTWVERGPVRVKFLILANSAMALVRARHRIPRPAH